MFFEFGLGFFSVFAFDVQIIKSLYIFTVALKSMFKRNTKRIAISIFIVRLSRVNNYNFELESFGHVPKMMMYICIKMSYVKYSKFLRPNLNLNTFN